MTDDLDEIDESIYDTERKQAISENIFPYSPLIPFKTSSDSMGTSGGELKLVLTQRINDESMINVEAVLDET